MSEDEGVSDSEIALKIVPFDVKTFDIATPRQFFCMATPRPDALGMTLED